MNLSDIEGNKKLKTEL